MLLWFEQFLLLIMALEMLLLMLWFVVLERLEKQLVVLWFVGGFNRNAGLWRF